LGGECCGEEEEVLQALPDGGDAAMEGGTLGAEDAMQCVWDEVQVGKVGAGVSAGGESDF